MLVIHNIIGFDSNNWIKFDHEKEFLVGPEIFAKSQRQFCLNKGGSLLSVHSDNENDFIRGLAKGNILTGGVRNAGDVSFKWLDGSDFDYQNWRMIPEKPLNKDSVLYISITGKWLDSYLHDVAYVVICQRSTATNISPNPNGKMNNYQINYQ